MTQLSKAPLSLIQDGQKGIPPCYGEKKIKEEDTFLHFTWDKIVLNFRSYFDISRNSNCYQTAEYGQYANGAKIQNGCFSAGQKDQGSSGNDHSTRLLFPKVL